MKAIWKGQLQVGLVSADIKLYKARDDGGTRLHLVHSCGHRPRQIYHCERCGVYLSRGELNKGFEVAGRMVILTDDDLGMLPLSSSRVLDIAGFVKDIDITLLDQMYYLAPDTGSRGRTKSAKAYWLLYDAMEQLGLTAIGQLALRERERLAAVRPLEHGIMLLMTLCYADEVRDPRELAPAREQVAEQEISLARQLVEAKVFDFRPDSYRDRYAEALEALLLAKAEGRELPQPQPQPQQQSDVVQQLIESLRR